MVVPVLQRAATVDHLADATLVVPLRAATAAQVAVAILLHAATQNPLVALHANRVVVVILVATLAAILAARLVSDVGLACSRSFSRETDAAAAHANHRVVANQHVALLVSQLAVHLADATKRE